MRRCRIVFKGCPSEVGGHRQKVELDNFFRKHKKGSLGKILWTVTVTDLAAQTQYVIDGVEEAVGELIVGVKATTVFKEACNEGSRTGFDHFGSNIEQGLFRIRWTLLGTK